VRVVTVKKLVRGILHHIRDGDWIQPYAEIKGLATEEEIINFREKHLEKLLVHAYHNVPYYSRILRDVGIIQQNDKVDLSMFNTIPILTKAIIREQGVNLISQERAARKWYYNSSGGSTGEPTRFMQDNVYDKWGNAASYYWYKDVLGIDEPNVKKVVLWGSERDLFQGGLGWRAGIANWLSNTVFLNSFKMNAGDMERYLSIINSYKPDLIRGYASSLYELCRYAQRRGIGVHTPRLIVSAAETLDERMRREIENVVRTRVYDFYGSREANNLAGECRAGVMHVLAFHNHIEILSDDSKPVQQGLEGTVIVTNLHNYSMPFIRYEIGDMAVLGPGQCKCGNQLPTLGKVTGRITDVFVLENGTAIPAQYFIHLIGVVCNKGSIRKFQVVQEDYRRVRILAIPETVIGESEKKDIADKIRLVMGEDCEVVWELVEEISKTSSGKYVYTKSLLSR
jgi:phenylacetate-CoA ligase